MTFLSKLFAKFPKLQQKIQQIPGSKKYVNPEGLIIPQHLGEFFNQVASEVYRGVGKPDGTSDISLTLEFDELQRVSNTVQPLIDGTSKVLPFQTIEKVNEMVNLKFKNAPTNYKVKSLHITIKNGDITTNTEYYS